MQVLNVLSEAEFEQALLKERNRAERRELVFSVIRMTTNNVGCEAWFQLAKDFRDRLRICDEIGQYQGSLTVLLPETSTHFARNVADELTTCAAQIGILVTADVFGYPAIDSDPRSRIPSELTHPPADNSVATRSNRVEGYSDRASFNENVTTAGSPLKVSEAVCTDRQPSETCGKLSFSRPSPVWKRLLDIVAASCGLVLLSPILLFAGLAIRVSSPGPVIFRQWREGKDGQLFQIYKFRTMRNGADEEQSTFQALNEQDGPAFKIKDDPRVTKLGRYLRKSCIDELPQLINVLRGEMSLVGPRPLPADESLNCSDWQRRRLDVLPGMTCIWQVDGGRDIPFDQWMRMDLEYVQKRGVRTDALLLAKTAMLTMLHRGSV